MKSSKAWIIVLVICLFSGLFGIASINIVIDPYFHYHKPVVFLSYPLHNERNINDGIVKRFVYDTVITGTSMTENFYTSEANELFECNSIKVPFSGGSYKETPVYNFCIFLNPDTI